jgi:methyltransferase (TIGR00027 family)
MRTCSRPIAGAGQLVAAGTLAVSDEEIQHTSESALLTAGWRAMESNRSDALFNDPLAAGLAGERGLRIARTRPDGASVVAIRTVLIDAFIRSAISSGIDTVINLGAGMDARPYRMNLPSSLHWVEVDHPSLIKGKTAHLGTELPACSIERIGLDLADRDARRELFDRIWTTSKRAMVLMEGVLGALSVDEACGLADDLGSQPGCEWWVIDYFSPRLLAAYQKHLVRFELHRSPVGHTWRITVLHGGGILLQREVLVRAEVVDPRTHRAGQDAQRSSLGSFEGTTTSPAMICARRFSICGRMLSMNPPL